MNHVDIAKFLFWACTAGVVYAYALYPILIWSLARCFGRSALPPQLADEDLPRVSLLIAAHDEEAVIEARIRNALAMDYPSEKLEIVIGSDGSTDRTNSIVRRYASRGVRLLEYPVRKGKASVLNNSIPHLSGELVLLSDANTEVDTSAAHRLARWFVDPSVGSVVGRLILVDPSTGKNADGLYWKYETFLKKNEARLGGLLGANGAIYAIRKNGYLPIPANTIIDDFVIPLLAKVHSGCSLIYDQDATAVEETAPDIASEFRRRVRIGAGGFQSIGILHRLLDPRQGWVAFTFLSHKLLRWLCPFFLIGMIAAATYLSLLQAPLYAIALASQVLFYLVSRTADQLPDALGRLKIIRLSAMFTGMNIALWFGFWRWLSSPQQGTWQRTARTIEVGMAQ